MTFVIFFSTWKLDAGTMGSKLASTDCRCPAVSVDLHDSALYTPPLSCTLLLFGVSLGLLFLATALLEESVTSHPKAYNVILVRNFFRSERANTRPSRHSR